MSYARLFQENVGLSQCERAIEFIRHDPCFIGKAADAAGKIMSVVADSQDASRFHVSKKIDHWVGRGIDQRNEFTWLKRTLCVGESGNISVFDGDEQVEEQLDNYLYNASLRQLYKAILSTGFYTGRDESNFDTDRLRLTHKQADGQRSWHLEIFRDGRAWYNYERHGYGRRGGGLIHLQNIQDQEVVDFHRQYIEPYLVQVPKNQGLTAVDYFFTLATLPSASKDVEKTASLCF